MGVKDNNYFVYHLHDDRSNTILIDSTTKQEQYIKRAKELGMTALAFSNHGNVFGWVKSKQLIEEAGMKFVFGVEAYLTMSVSEKIRDSFHVGIYARNYDGVLEINKLISNSYNKEDNHFYYRPRITYDELLGTSNNVIITTACLANFLWKWEKENNWYQQEDFLKFAQRNRDRIFLELQYHNNDEQKEYNKLLLGFAEDYNLNIIAGTDTHSIDNYAAECRTILQKAKKIEFSNEDNFDLTFKTRDELYNAFAQQGVLTPQQIDKAIDNTNVMSSMVSEFELDYGFKYPNLYKDPNTLLKKRIINRFKDMMKIGALDKERFNEYKERIKEEYDAYEKLGMASYMLFVSEMCDWAYDNNIPIGYGRGSVTGSLVAYLLGITDVDSIKYGTVFSRFVNADRISLPDIDLDFAPDDRERVYDYIRGRMGTDNTSKIILFGTTKDKKTIDEIVRALGLSLDLGKNIKSLFEEDEEKARERYPDVMYYFDGIKNTIVSKGAHPSGMIASPTTLSDNLGTIRDEDNQLVSSCGMKDVDSLNYVKLDILGLKNIAIINDTYKYIGSKYLKSYEIDFEDEEVWKDIKTHSAALFQFEGNFAFESLKRFNAKSLMDMCIVNAAIRPSGASYRDRLFAGVINENPSKEINEILKDSYNYLIFQEQTIKFLQLACGFSGSEADSGRKIIGKKLVDEIPDLIKRAVNGYCNNAGKDKSRDIAEQEAQQFMQILQDSSDYQFSYNHAISYSMIGYTCGYLRYYHPLEFITSLLNNAKDESDVVQGESLAKLKDIPVEPIKFGRSKGAYAFNKEENKIYKGISSIKFLQNKIANQLFDLYNEKEFDTFISLLVAITEDTSVNTKQLDILIKTDFFSEFGEIGKLLAIKNEFQNGVNKYKKTHIDKTKGKRLTILLNYENNIGNNFEEFDIINSIQFELNMLGKPFSRDDDYPKKRFLVMSIDTKYSPKLNIYSINSGKSHRVKIYKGLYKKSKKIKTGDILVVHKSEKVGIRYKDGNGDWIQSKDKMEIVIRDYNVIRYDD